jgi:hypothetical protein
MENISRIYWLPNIRKKIKTCISNCLKCIEFLSFSAKIGFLHSIKKDNIPFQTIHVDHFDLLEKSNGMKFTINS